MLRKDRKLIDGSKPYLKAPEFLHHGRPLSDCDSTFEHTHKSVKYTCSREGPYKDGYLDDAHPPLPLKTPKIPKAGMTTERKEVEKKPVAYWKAQCAFRGLNQTAAINDLQLRIREAKKPMLLELKEIEKELNKEFSEEE